MRRREFIAALSGAAAWPVLAQAQQPGKLPTIGYPGGTAPLIESQWVATFVQRLRELGWIEGRTVAIEYRWADGHYERLPMLATDLVRRQVAVIAAISGTPAAMAAKAATTTIPIVFAIGGDPVVPELVPNLNRPGGNITGTSFYATPVVTKRLELAREFAPQGTTIGVFVNPDNPPSVTEGTTLQAAAEALDQPIAIVNVSAERDIDGAFAAIVRKKVGALIVSSDPLFFLARKMLVVSMARYALPTIFADREQVEAGGLVSYGASRPDAYRQAGNYVGRVVKGENPGDLPIVLPTKSPAHQPQDRQGARTYRAAYTTRPRRRGDRVTDRRRPVCCGA